MTINLLNSFITDNSNECTKGCYFMQTSTNEQYVLMAKEHGANIISIEECKKLLGIDKNIKIIGITGTNGKTTTAAAIYSMLLDLGYNVGLSGTRGAFINDNRIDEKGLTTSSIFKTIYYLYEASKNKCDFFVMEVSSHAIEQNRIEGLNFYLKVFTNLSQDHLDYHKTMQEYARVKSSFFADESNKLINSDDEHIQYNLKNAQTYAVEKPATYGVICYSIKNNINAIFRVPGGEVEIESDLVGQFNLYNLLAAFAAVKNVTSKSNEDIATALSNFAGVEGRVEIVNKNPLVIVDFAHTPDGIEKVLDALKNNKLIVVFGAGGDRDHTKRPIMGSMVEHFAKIAIITTDNPRSENPLSIIEEIESGMRKKDIIIKEVDRKKAIQKAIDLAKNNETIVILGKGDETYQEINGIKHHFNDKECVQEILNTKTI